MDNVTDEKTPNRERNRKIKGSLSAREVCNDGTARFHAYNLYAIIANVIVNLGENVEVGCRRYLRMRYKEATRGIFTECGTDYSFSLSILIR